MPLVLTQAPSTEPIALDEAKNHLKVDSDLVEDDGLITMMISAARRYAETKTQRSFITQKWALVQDCFPGGARAIYGLPAAEYSHPASAVLLTRGPVQSVDSIVYVDMAGVTQTIATPGAPDYAIDLTGAVARMSPGFGRVWPIPLPQMGSVRFNYTCGYGSNAAAVPETVKLWMLAAIQTMYRNRGVLIQLARGERTDAFDFIDGLLDGVSTVLA